MFALIDGIAATILNSKFASQHKSPSVIYFEARTALRNNCQKEWFYEPANSQFCRRHPVIQILHRLLALVDPIPIDETSDRLQMKFFRWIRVQNRRSAQIIGLHRIMTRAAVNQAKDTLSHYITASLMRLKIAHQRKQTRYIRNVRMIFLNRVGMFVSWYVYDVAKWNQLLATNATEESKHCAVMFSVKMQPFISICTETQKPIISIFESDYGIGIILRHNRLISLSNNYLERQFRIENNRNIDLDQLQTVDLHSVIFNCTNNRNLLTIGNVTVSEYHSAEMEEKEEEEEEIGGNETIGKVNGHHRQKRSTGSPPARSSHLGYIALLLGYVGICCAVLAFLYFMRHK